MTRDAEDENNPLHINTPIQHLLIPLVERSPYQLSIATLTMYSMKAPFSAEPPWVSQCSLTSTSPDRLHLRHHLH